jgi:hypothetical protein
MGSQWFWTNSIGTQTKSENGDIWNKDLAFTFFPQPIITDLITLGDISYSATPQQYQTLPRSTDGHNVRFEIELVGCENYQLEAGKHCFLRFIVNIPFDDVKICLHSTDSYYP